MKTFSNLITLFLGLTLLSSCSKQVEVPTGELFILTNPEGATVEVNNTFIGTTPLQGEPVPAGPCLVTIRKEGYESEYFSYEMASGSKELRKLDLRPLGGLVVIESSPPGASVTIEEVYQGKTPLALHDINLGSHRARLQLLGYNDKEIEFDVKDRIPMKRSVVMESNSGTLVVHSSPSGATLYVDGRNEGITPRSLDRILKGERTISLELGGHEPFTRTVLINPDGVARVDATLNPLPGSLSVATLPEGARVYVNGELKGESPVNLDDMPPGTYTVRVDKRGHAEQQRAVTIGLGEQKVEEFRLERNSGILQLVTRPAGVQVSIDGEFVGKTKAPEGRGDTISLPLQIDLLSQGSHTLQLVREGYTFENKRFFIQKDEVTVLEERLQRRFIPNTIVRTGDGEENVHTGVLIRRHLNGDIEMELRPGIFRIFRADDVISVEPLKQEENL